MIRVAPGTVDPSNMPRRGSDGLFLLALSIIGGLYVLLIVGMLAADIAFLRPSPSTGHALNAGQALAAMAGKAVAPLRRPEIRFALRLSLLSCSITAILSVFFAVPLGYILSRFRFPLRGLLDAVLDIPIVLPPLVIGLSLLILLQTPPGRFIERHITITYAAPAVILAQFTVACAFAVRTMRATFDQQNPRTEQVAMTLGCSRFQAFWLVTLPEASRGMLTAGTLAWARALGEFGPILVFAGTTRFRTEVLPTSIFLEFSVGNLDAAVAISMLMVAAAVGVLIVIRFVGGQGLAAGAVRR